MYQKCMPLCCFLCLSFGLSSTPARDKEEASVTFPFPAEADRTKGQTGAYPNRVRDGNTGMWYVYVPGGKYRIGTNDRFDSKQIEVTLSGFYISETRVSCDQIGRQLEKELPDIAWLEGAFKEIDDGKFDPSKEWKDFTPEQMKDWVLSMSLMKIVYSEKLKSRSMNDLWDLRSDALTFASRVLLDASKGKVVTLTAKQREEAKAILAELSKGIKAFRARGGTAYHAPHSTAAEYAEQCGVSLPTEGQWEVAARLNADGKIRLAGMNDDLLEWCSDHYAYDYFERNRDFTDPKGPEQGRLTKEQLRERSDSSVGLFARGFARSVRVLRGKDPSTRAFGLNVDAGIRLVYTPNGD